MNMKKIGLLLGFITLATVFTPRNINDARGEQTADYRWLLEPMSVAKGIQEGLNNLAPAERMQIKNVLPEIESILPGIDRAVDLPAPAKFLSGGALSYLMSRYGQPPPGQLGRTVGSLEQVWDPSFTQPEENIFLKAAFSPNIRVNNPATDQIRGGQTTQSETSIAVNGRNVVVGWNDSGQFQRLTGSPGVPFSDEGVSDAARSFTGYGFSTDGGATFTDGGAIRSPQPRAFSASFGDPSVAVHRRTGTFYFAALHTLADTSFTPPPGTSIIGVSKSTDGGRTFSRPVNASIGIFGGTPPPPPPAPFTPLVITNAFEDKELITVDNTGGPNDGNVYVSWTDFFNTPAIVRGVAPGTIIVVAPNAQIMFSRSTNRGASFSRLAPVSPLGETIFIINAATARAHLEMTFPQGSIPAVGPNGEVYVAWEQVTVESEFRILPRIGLVLISTDQTRSIRIAKSTDGGQSFGADLGVRNVQVAKVNPVPFFDDVPRAGGIANPGCPCSGVTFFGAWKGRGGGIRSQEFPTLAVDTTNGPNRGNVYVVWNAVNGTNGTDIFLSRSTDGGRTWSKAKLANRSGEQPTHDGDQFEPQMAVAPDGTIGISYYSREFDPQNELMGVMLAASKDGGRTFSWQLVSNVLFPPPLTAVRGGSAAIGNACTNFDPAVGPCYMGEYNGIAADAGSFYISWGDNRTRVGSRNDPDVFFAKVPIPPF